MKWRLIDSGEAGGSRPGAPARSALGRGLENHLLELWPESEIATWGEGATQDEETTILYLAAARGDRHGVAPDLIDAEAILEALSSEPFRHLILVSSSAIHEPSAHHPQLLAEGRQAPRRRANPLSAAWHMLEVMAAESCGDRALTILRPTPTLVPGGEDYWSRMVQKRLALTVPGFDPCLQFLALEDLARAVAATGSQPPEPGEHRVFHVAPRRAIPLRAALRRAGTWRLPMPGALQRVLRSFLFPMVPAHQLDWLRYGSTVSAERIREQLDFEAQLSSQEAIDACGGRGARAAGIPGKTEEAEEPFDVFGLDRAYHRRLSATLFRFLQKSWWRVEYRGLEYVPREGPAVLAGVHRGFQPWDGVMAMDQIARVTGRYLRFLVHPTLIKAPFLTPYMLKLGGVPACRENAEWVLDRGGLVGIFPEGIRGAFKTYGRDIYELGKFGRDEYVRFAIRAGVPIVPFVTVGSAEIFPILARFEWGWWRRVVEWPYFPITPTMGLIPLPSKWHTRFLQPVPTDHLGPEAAEDRRIVRELSDQVRAQMRGALDEMLAKRQHIFWGSFFEPEEEMGAAEELA